MSKIARQTAQIFGSTASAAQIAQFGSLAAGSPVTYSGSTATPDNVQALGNWLQGWFAGVEGPSSPAIEDLNAYCYVMAYQIAYLMQEGVPEYDAATTYYAGSIVNDGSGNLYVAITTTTGNALTNTTYWKTNFSVSGSNASPQAVGGSTGVSILSSGLNQDIYVEGNGSGWTNQAAAASQTWIQVVWSPELSLYASCAYSNAIMTSPDGVTWTSRTVAGSGGFAAIDWSPSLGLFVTTPTNVASSVINTSPDGVTWTSRSNPDDTQNWNSVKWSANLGIFAAVSDVTGTNNVMYSTNGTSWTQVSGLASNLWYCVTYSPQLNLFIGLGNGSNVLWSNNGTTWKITAATNANGLAIDWSPQLGMFVAANGTGGINYSYDGFNWTNVATTLHPFAVIWSSDLEIFIAAGLASGGTSFITSQNGITWSASTGPSPTETFSGITYSRALKQFCAVCQSGAHQVNTLNCPAITASAAIAAGSVQSQRINLIGSSATLPAVITNGNGVNTSNQQQIALWNNDSAQFMWDNSQSVWIQI